MIITYDFSDIDIQDLEYKFRFEPDFEDISEYVNYYLKGKELSREQIKSLINEKFLDIDLIKTSMETDFDFIENYLMERYENEAREKCLGEYDPL